MENKNNIKNKNNLKDYLVISALGLVLLSSIGYGEIMGVANADTQISNERSAGEIVDDATIKSLIKTKLAENGLFTNVGVKVIEGRVLLTGKVKSPLDKLEAIKIAWVQSGVKEVNSEIVVTNNTSSSAAQISKDSWITSEVKSKLLVTPNIKSVNYSFETIDGVVYILGIAQSQDELNKVIEIARKIGGVNKVINYVRISK